MRRRRSESRRGSTILEFGLCLLVLAPALLGMFTVGMNLTRNLQAVQVARDAGHMYVRSVDFSEAKNQQLLARLAKELKMVQDGTLDTPNPTGNAVIILTKFHVPNLAECIAAGLDAGDCVNIGVPVIVQRLWTGNEDIFQSPFGTPAKAKLKGKGAVDNKDMLQEVALRATHPEMLPLIPEGQDAYLAEVYVASPDFDLASVMTGTGVYARAIY
jgi:hypothetical protein